MPLIGFKNIAAAGLGFSLLLPAFAQAQTATPQTATTQAAAAQATGRNTTDGPATSQSQGTAWAVKQAAGAPAGAPRAAGAAPLTPHGDIVTTLAASGQFTTFLKAVDAVNLTSVLKNNSNLTVFAPTDAAFAALPPGELDRLMADKPTLQKLLTHHIINARVDRSKITNARGPVPSVAGNPVMLDGTGPVLKADNAEIVQADVMASNGVIDVVDQVLTPGAGAQAQAPAAAAAGQPAAATAPQAPSAQTPAQGQIPGQNR
jgi:uncharacterized surface protein with fasciclin (FAS1) repeats